jgi:hypothetical protein
VDGPLKHLWISARDRARFIDRMVDIAMKHEFRSGHRLDTVGDER